MPAWKIPQVQQLATSFHWAPMPVVTAQLARIEDLALSLDAASAYSWAWVIREITAGKTRVQPDGSLLSGSALRDDLLRLMDYVTRQRRVQPPPDRTLVPMGQWCLALGVSSKTLQRWRHRGLPAWWLESPSQPLGLHVSVHAMERFAARAGAIPASCRVGPFSKDEERQVTLAATRLSHLPRSTVLRRLARQFGRWEVALGHLLDSEGPLSFAPEPTEAQVRAASQAIAQGVPLGKARRDTLLDRQTLYWLGMDARLEHLRRQHVVAFDDPFLDGPDSAAAVDAIARDAGHPSPGQSPTRQQERAMFLKYNFLKLRFLHARRSLGENAGSRRLRQLEAMLSEVIESRNQIVEANFGLVVSAAGRHARCGYATQDLLGEGAIILIRAVENFDYRKGFRLGTYAGLALLKGFARMPKRSIGAVATDMSQVPFAGDTTSRMVERDSAAAALALLPTRQADALRSRFGLAERGEEGLQVTARRRNQLAADGLSRLRVLLRT